MMIHRLATLKDFTPVFDLYMEKSANPHLTFDPMSMEDFKTIYKKLLKTETVFVVEDERSVIATYRLISKTDRQAHTLYLGSFTIKKEQQGKGFGTQILTHIKAFALERNKTRIELTVDINNAAGISLYKKTGFLIEGQIRNSYRRSDTNEYYDEYLMGVLL